jgi:hypothetical protein
MSKYNTARKLEHLDLMTELNSYSSVGMATDQISEWSGISPKYFDCDIYFIMIKHKEKQYLKILDLLRIYDKSAWFEFDEGSRMVKVERISSQNF